MTVALATRGVLGSTVGLATRGLVKKPAGLALRGNGMPLALATRGTLGRRGSLSYATKGAENPYRSIQVHVVEALEAGEAWRVEADLTDIPTTDTYGTIKKTRLKGRMKR